MSQITEKVSEIVKGEIQPDNWQFHVSVVAERAIELGKIYDVDLEIIELAALLHDVGRQRFGGENHEFTGAENAVEVLTALGYDEKKIGVIEKCILKHRGRGNNLPETIEERVLANADAMSHFDQAFYLIALRAKKIGFEAAVAKTIKGLEERWNGKLDLPDARELVRDERDAVYRALGQKVLSGSTQGVYVQD